MVTLVALMSTFGLGMCFSLLGSISVKLMPRLNIDQGKFGNLISAFMFSCLVASLIIGVLTDIIGFQKVAIGGFLLTSICILILAYGKTFQTVLIPCLLLGFGAMAMNVVGNVMGMMVIYEGQREAAANNLVNVFFGLGLFLTPLIVSNLFKRMSYEKSVSVLAFILIIPFLLSLFGKGFPQAEGLAISDAFKLLSQPAIIIAALTLFCYISLESSFCNWLPSFGKDVIKSESPGTEEARADASAQNLLALFAIAMMAGRLIASQIPIITEKGGFFIAGSGLASAVLIYLMMNSKNIMQARILAFLAGLAFAPAFPTTVGVTKAIHPANFGSAFGIIFAVGLAGAVIVPNAIGKLAKGSSVQKSLKLLLPMCVVLIVLALVLGGIDPADTGQPTASDEVKTFDKESAPPSISPGDSEALQDEGRTMNEKLENT